MEILEHIKEAKYISCSPFTAEEVGGNRK